MKEFNFDELEEVENLKLKSSLKKNI